MRLINKKTREEIEATFTYYTFNPELKQKELGIVVIDNASREVYRYGTLKDMCEDWVDLIAA